MIVNGEDTIRLDEFVHLCRLKESKVFRYYELVPKDRKARLIVKLPSSFCYWKSRYYFVYGGGWETPFDDLWGDGPSYCVDGRPQNLVHCFLQEIF